jgi:hypothetical protein
MGWKPLYVDRLGGVLCCRYHQSSSDTSETTSMTGAVCIGIENSFCFVMIHQIDHHLWIITSSLSGSIPLDWTLVRGIIVMMIGYWNVIICLSSPLPQGMDKKASREDNETETCKRRRF